MTSQKRWGGTVSAGMGFPIIDGAHPYFRRAKPEEALPLIHRKPGAPAARQAEPTMALDASEIEILSDNTQGAAPAPQRPQEPTMEISATDFVVEDDKPAKKVPSPPPKKGIRPLAPSMRPSAEVAERETEESGGYSLDELLGKAPPKGTDAKPRADDSSVIASLEDIQRIGEEHAREQASKPPAPKPVQKPEEEPAGERESSVIASMEELRGMHAKRVADEAASQLAAQEAAAQLAAKKVAEAAEKEAAAAAAAAEREAEALLLESELQNLFDTSEAGRSLRKPAAAVVAEGRESLPGPEIEISGESDAIISEETDTSISIELIFGLPWEDGHRLYTLTEREQEECEGALPEREKKWVLPVPPSDTKDKGQRAVLDLFSNETRRTFNGKEYYIVDAPFAGAKSVARTGKVLHMWSEAITDFEYLGEPSAGFDVNQPQTGEWAIGSVGVILSAEEAAQCALVIPDRKPVFLHPVPKSEGQGVLEHSLMEGISGNSIPRVTLGGNDYYVMEIGTIAEWQECAFMYPKLRIASRSGEWLSIWPESETGRSLMAVEFGFTRTVHGPESQVPIESGAAAIRPYESELAAIQRLHQGGKSRWLYPLPGKIGSMDSDSLNFLMAVSAKETEQTGISPLISLQGRWYISLKYPHPDAREAKLEGDTVIVNPASAKLRDVLAEVRARSAERWEARQMPIIVLPPKMEDRKPLLDMFPEGVTKYLYFVDPANSGYVSMKPHVALTREGQKEVYLVLDKPYQGAIAVCRNGVAIKPVE